MNSNVRLYSCLQLIIETTQPLIVGAFLGTLVFGVLFILVEQRQRRPMFDLALFRKPRTRVGSRIRATLLRIRAARWRSRAGTLLRTRHTSKRDKKNS